MPVVSLDVELARGGDRLALERVLAVIRDPIYNLALRMLWHPQDAEDATQEILVRVVTRLDGFRGEAAFETWAFRVAANHLLTTRRRRAEQARMTFEGFAADLADGVADPHDHGVDEHLLAEEVKIGCTHAMLQCLDREHRLAYVLGEVFELPSAEAADALGIDAAAYRKRLQRARSRIADFVGTTCGLVTPAAACRCRKRIDRAVALGRVEPSKLLFARGTAEMERLRDAAALLRSNPRPEAPRAATDRILALLESGRFPLVAGDGGG